MAHWRVLMLWCPDKVPCELSRQTSTFLPTMSQIVCDNWGCSSTAVCYILEVWCLCCWSSGGIQNVLVPTVEHIALVSRVWWQFWRPQLSPVRATGRTTGPMKTSDLNLIWWLLQRILFQAVLADTVAEYALRLLQPVVSQVWQVLECGLQDPAITANHSSTRKCSDSVHWIWAPSGRRKERWLKP